MDFSKPSVLSVSESFSKFQENGATSVPYTVLSIGALRGGWSLNSSVTTGSKIPLEQLHVSAHKTVFWLLPTLWKGSWVFWWSIRVAYFRMINFMDVTVVASYIWLCCSCVCFLKIVTRRPPTAIIPFRHAGNIFPCDSSCPPNHLSRCQDLKATHKSFEKPKCWLTPWQLYLKAISSYGVIFILHHHAPCQDPFFSQKATIFLILLFLLLLLDVRKSLPASTDGQCPFLFCVTRAWEDAFTSDC